MRKLRVGIVGAGGLVADVHFEAYRTLSTIEARNWTRRHWPVSPANGA
jgi:predicted dehydrogenase